MYHISYSIQGSMPGMPVKHRNVVRYADNWNTAISIYRRRIDLTCMELIVHHASVLDEDFHRYVDEIPEDSNGIKIFTQSPLLILKPISDQVKFQYDGEFSPNDEYGVLIEIVDQTYQESGYVKLYESGRSYTKEVN